MNRFSPILPGFVILMFLMSVLLSTCGNSDTTTDDKQTSIDNPSQQEEQAASNNRSGGQGSSDDALGNTTNEKETATLYEAEENSTIAPPPPAPEPAPMYDMAPQRERHASVMPGARASQVQGIMQEQPASTRPSVIDTDEEGFNTEEYDPILENPFLEVLADPVSTFSIDVDTASYSNVRRFINDGQKPNAGAVRIEELINYFHYDYPKPTEDTPFSVNLALTECPWNTNHQIVKVGLQGKEVPMHHVPPANLVFLLDVSGSMNQPNKLPLLKRSFKILVDNLRDVDRVAIVVYAGNAGLVLPSTWGQEKRKMIEAMDRLEAGGSTAGGAGIQLAYNVAQEHFIEGGNNRIILATDGDFNVGISSRDALVELIEEKRQSGIFLSILGLGMGNYSDSNMESLSNAGNGNYYYIDSIAEANKVFGEDLWGTLLTIAKDVKIQIEFNPAQVFSYRLIGYENRMLRRQDFDNDAIDAGEIGSNHSVTALYEIVPADSDEAQSSTEPLRYQDIEIIPSEELMQVKLRYKLPDEDQSNLLEQSIRINDIYQTQPANDFRFAMAVAEFGMLLRNSEYKGTASFTHLISLLQMIVTANSDEYRKEFFELVKRASEYYGL